MIIREIAKTLTVYERFHFGLVAISAFEIEWEPFMSTISDRTRELIRSEIIRCAASGCLANPSEGFSHDPLLAGFCTASD